MTGFPVTTSAYGWTIPELLVDELEEGFDIVVRREIAVEMGNTSGPVGQIAKNASDVLTRDAGDDHHDRRAVHPSAAHSSDSARARSTSARASTASAMATSVAAARAVSTSSPSPQDPFGAWVSVNTSAMRSAVARKASSPVRPKSS